MDSIVLPTEPALALARLRASAIVASPSFRHQSPPCKLATRPCRKLVSAGDKLRFRRAFGAAAVTASLTDNSIPSKNGIYTVGDFMTQKDDLHVVTPATTVDEALEALVENRITGFPVVDENWKLVGLISDYDLLALDSISGNGKTESGMFPQVGSTWKTFNEVQNLLNKTNGKVVGDLMTPAPLVVRENSNLEDAARLLLETKYRRLPVVDGAGKLVGIITRGNVVRAALQVKRANEKKSQ